jgi:hypothetical protein
MFFTLVIKNNLYPLVSPVVMELDPVLGEPMSLERARYLAEGMLDEYIKNNALTGRAVRRARSEVQVLQPQHFVSLDGLHIELRHKEIILNATLH